MEEAYDFSWGRDPPDGRIYRDGFAGFPCPDQITSFQMTDTQPINQLHKPERPLHCQAGFHKPESERLTLGPSQSKKSKLSPRVSKKYSSYSLENSTPSKFRIREKSVLKTL